MNKTILSVMTIAAIGLTSCDKAENLSPTSGAGSTSSIDAEAINQEASVLLSSSDYTKSTVEDLSRPSSTEPYNEGVIEYSEHGEVTVRVDFGADAENALITTKHGEEHKCMKGKGDGEEKYDKVIIDPIVKTEDCEHPVAGSFELYDGEEWVATIDFGDGTCDDIATKTTAEGTTEFTLKDRKKGKCGPKGKKGHGPKGKEGKGDLDKKIIEPIIKLDGCEFPVSGVVGFYKDDVMVGSLNYGNGACDNLAIKTTPEGTFEITLDHE